MKQKSLYIILFIVGFMLTISESDATFAPNIMGLIILYFSGWKLRLFTTQSTTCHGRIK